MREWTVAQHFAIWIALYTTVLGLIGLATQLAINLVVAFVFKRSEFFSQQWWSDFFPGYLVWFVFAVIGFGGARGAKGG